MKLYKSLFTITAIAALVAPALTPTSAMAQTASGRGISSGGDAVAVAAPQVRDLGLTVRRITEITTQIGQCAATGQLREDGGGCDNGLLPIEIRFEKKAGSLPTRLYIQDLDGIYEGNAGAGSNVYYKLDGRNGVVNLVPFGS